MDTAVIVAIVGVLGTLLGAGIQAWRQPPRQIVVATELTETSMALIKSLRDQVASMEETMEKLAASEKMLRTEVYRLRHRIHQLETTLAANGIPIPEPV